LYYSTSRDDELDDGVRHFSVDMDTFATSTACGDLDL